MAIKILICDDLIAEAEKIRKMIELYAEKAMLPFDVTICSSPNEIAEKIQNSALFDILFLDIYMDSLNGINLAKLIRKDNLSSRIVFVSASNNHALEAFDVNASQYLVKPVSYSKFSQTMDALLKQDLGDQFISASTGTQIIKIFLRDFVYSETQRHYQAVCFSNGSVERFRINGTALFDKFGGQKRFVRVGASYIINLDYVLRIMPDSVELIGSHTIPIPRRALAELKQKYFDYYCDMEEL